MPTFRSWGVALSIIIAPALSAQTTAPAQSAVPIPPTLKVFDPSFIDRSANACHDFFAFANGGWVKRDTIPAAFSSSGVSKDMTDRNELVVRSVLDDAMAQRHSKPAKSTVAKLGTFYASCMDSARADKDGINPIKPQLDSITAIKSRPELVREIASLQTDGVNVLFNFFPAADPKDAAHYIAWASQGGLGMPDRDYYTNSDPASDSLRRKYVAHITKTLTLAGEPPAAAAADAARVMALETELAKASMTRLQRRDPNATYHKTPVAALSALAPAIDWPVYFRTVGLTSPVSFINVSQPDFLKRASILLTTLPLDDWRAYLRYHLVSAASPWLSTPFVAEDFAYGSLYSGTKQLLPRWKRCLRVTDRKLGEALGEAYVAKTFSPEAKAQATQVIDDIRASFRDRLNKLMWMSDSTRRYALSKLAAMNEKVGYPDTWRDYSELRVVDGAFAPNVFSANAFEWQRVANRPGKPVDKAEWDMTVPTVNAYYDPSINEMVFPAGALAPQTFDATGDLASNYGSLGGSWAGHELTHGFDDEGRRYDAEGNLRDWWAPMDSVRFTGQAQLIVDQFNGYIQVDTIHVNGKLTLGENLADFGGLVTAYDALERALDRTGKREVIDGYTPEQRFFIAYAQSWRSHTRPEQLRTRVKTDPHAPAEWRTNGPVSNMPQFAEAFHCKPGDPMVRPPDK
ncbi:MAG TPA: M13 family metallopeptidase, partial [Vicinamibacterales bacterium]|nr:M13 family metallopeptidase [Vicinamibacterales bacterium]